jgi:hypothetical protein
MKQMKIFRASYLDEKRLQNDINEFLSAYSSYEMEIETKFDRGIIIVTIIYS